MTLSLMAIVGIGLVLQASGAAVEAAFVFADRTTLQELAQEGDRGAGKALQLGGEEQVLIAANYTLMITALAASVAVISTIWGPPTSASALPWLAFGAVVVVFGEVVPRRIGRWHADTLARTVAPVAGLAMGLVGRPLKVLFRLLGAPYTRRIVGEVSREELTQLMDEHTATALDDDDRRLIRKFLELNDTPVSDCMTPLVAIVAVDEAASVQEAARLVSTHRHTKLPVWRGRFDHVVGVVEARDLMLRTDATRVAALSRPARFVPANKKASKLLEEMRRDDITFAVVVNEFGGTIGVVTLEDLLEEILGEIRDERDPEQHHMRQTGEREWRLSARISVEEVSAAIRHPLPEGDYVTVAGLILDRIGRFPTTGEVVEIGDGARPEGALRFRIEDCTDRTIVTVTLILPPPPASSAS